MKCKHTLIRLRDGHVRLARHWTGFVQTNMFNALMKATSLDPANASGLVVVQKQSNAMKSRYTFIQRAQICTRKARRQREKEVKQCQLQALKHDWEISEEHADTIEKRQNIYEKKWKLLNSEHPLFPLEFKHIPWPVLNLAERPEDIDQEGVERFVFGSFVGINRRRAAKKALRLWHLDKLDRVIQRVVPSQRSHVESAANSICKILMTGPSGPSGLRSREPM
jgi:hypothetical protein